MFYEPSIYWKRCGVVIENLVKTKLEHNRKNTTSVFKSKWTVVTEKINGYNKNSTNTRAVLNTAQNLTVLTVDYT